MPNHLPSVMSFKLQAYLFKGLPPGVQLDQASKDDLRMVAAGYVSSLRSALPFVSVRDEIDIYIDLLPEGPGEEVPPRHLELLVKYLRATSDQFSSACASVHPYIAGADWNACGNILNIAAAGRG